MSVDHVDYPGEGLSVADLLPTPWQQAKTWVDEAVARSALGSDVPEPLSIAVATVDGDGAPDVRTVLMRFFDERGPGFVTCLTSTKSQQLQGNPAIAAALTWPAMFRAIRFRGVAEELGLDEVTDYFDERPWGSRISAWTSRQSEPIDARDSLEAAYAEYAARWPETGEPGEVPVPGFWGGYRIRCTSVEFWGGRSNRLHDRFRFTRIGEGDLDTESAWAVERLQP
ncbi:MAG: pyridoxamine 5'-phosphate oxidase [Nostocoides sp.]